MSTNHFFSAFSFISFVLVSIPFAWHLEACNAATCLYIVWVSLSNLIYFVNSVVWDRNVGNWSPVWCDISGRIALAAVIAIPATCLCIQRRLYNAVVNPVLRADRRQMRRLIMVEMAIGVGIPILHIALAYVVQPERYEIVEDFGCRILIIDNPLSILLVFAWRLVISLISGLYGCINVYHVWIRRQTVRSILSSSAGGLNVNYFLRLFLLSGIDLLITIPFNIWLFRTNFPISPWRSFAEIHDGFSTIQTFPASVWKAHLRLRVLFDGTRWISVVYAFIFFIIFGFTDDARGRYMSVLRSIAKKVGYQTGSFGPSEPQVSEQYQIRPDNSESTFGSDLVVTVFSGTHVTSDKPIPLGFSDQENRGAIGHELKSAPLLDSRNPLSSNSQLSIARVPPSENAYDLDVTRARTRSLV